MIPKIISHYKIVEQIGSGGMGVVYKAEDVKLKRPVALKFLPPEMTRDAESKARFIREAQAASSLDHLNVCTIYEIDETEDRIFIAMGFIEGKSLLEKINEERLKIKDIVDLAIQIAGGLQAAHEHGIVHRDIKPANILITNDHVVKIVDFGLAKLSRQTKLTMNGTTLGTVAYMSPEQARGEEVDQRTDIWSLGAVLYEMLTGQRPFQGEYDQAVLYSIINDQPEPPSALRSGVPPELERIVLKMLAKDPAKRYQSVNDLLVDLTNLKESTETKGTADFKPANNSQKKTFIKQLIYAGIF
ncbi:MAG TPA: serine/threonine protein kinase, partial [Caldithrix abyssi]|nr:serine/threonine protein kinase [Caldithrix abyssi]